jgi:hypothetical protein
MTARFRRGFIHLFSLELHETIPSVVVSDQEWKRLLHHGCSGLRGFMIVNKQMKRPEVAGDVRGSGCHHCVEKLAFFSWLDSECFNPAHNDRDLIGVVASILEQRRDLVGVVQQEYLHRNSIVQIRVAQSRAAKLNLCPSFRNEIL